MPSTATVEAEPRVDHGWRFCDVIACPRHALPETHEVVFERGDKTTFLFRAHFCACHTRAFQHVLAILVEYIEKGRIRGVDPNILRGL